MAARLQVFGSLALDPSTGVVMRDGVPLPIGRRGSAILAALLEAGGNVVSKDELLSRGWPNLTMGEDNLSVQIAALRKALGSRPDGGEWIATVHRVGYRFVGDPTEKQERGSTRPLIAVLPFEDLSAVGVVSYFADGMVEDIITALSRFPTFTVVSRSASFAHRGENPRDAAQSLGVRYVLTGSVQRQADRLRVTVQLIDGERGLQRWVEKFDGEVAKLFEFQDRITEVVAGFVEPGILKAEIERVRRKPPANLGAYELYLRALPLFRSTDEASRVRAIALLENAISRDPEFSIGLAFAAWAYERQDTFGVGVSPVERARALGLAEQALRTAPDDPLVQAICAVVFLNIAGEVERSLAMLARAESQSPHEATVLSLYAFANVMVGDVELGREAFTRALRIAPGALDSYELMAGIAIACLFQGNFNESASWASRSIAQNGDWLGAYWILTAAHVQLGQLEEARNSVARLSARAPLMRVRDLERVGRRYAERFQLVVEAMRTAGLPQ